MGGRRGQRAVSVPNCPFFRQRQRLWFGDERVIHHDAATRPQGWNGRSQDFDHMVIGPVVEDVSEQVDVGRVYIGRDRFFRATNDLRAVLHDKFEARGSTSERDAGGTCRASDIHDSSRALLTDRGQGVALDEEFRRVAESVCESRHCACVTLGHLRVRAVVLECRLSVVCARFHHYNGLMSLLSEQIHEGH